MDSPSQFDPNLIISHKFPETTVTYTERDSALYALGVGACAKDALDENELKYVYHQNGQKYIQVLPTFAALFSLDLTSELTRIRGFQFDPRLLLHGQQYIEIYKPLPSAGTILSKACVSGLHDKGKATIVEIEIVSYDKMTNEPLCMNRMSVYLRGTGGFSKSSTPYSYSKNPPNQNITPKIPQTQPFAVHEECTHPAQALLYRLSGDYNPLHSDPTIAEVAGFSRPILHGLCSLGFAVRSIIKCVCKGDPNMVRSISGRFLLHVYPGETLITEMWLQNSGVVIYQVKVKERGKAVLSGIVGLNQIEPSL
ncbi:enoyl-CoA hydratase 2, peroxisomal [Impatiens glandulifera]|uniref:enoyl-CoA hydratase 2, peroxisomal n=1 Tax=Impatiens glandulifera TaxID=253017 RepID=UPI001FB14D51|nr:enoyl-CoA hydratase 2, peroxisomal [Impatiens glandulifera]